MGVADKAVGHRRDVDQPVLVYADVHKGAEGRNVGDHAVDDHSRPQVRDFLDVGKRRRDKRRTRITPRLLKFGEYVLQRGQPHRVVHVLGKVQRPERAAGVVHHPPGHGIGLRVHAGGIQGLRAAGDAEEARALLERLCAEPRNLEEVLPAGEGAVGVAVGDNVLTEQGAHPGHPRQQRR